MRDRGAKPAGSLVVSREVRSASFDRPHRGDSPPAQGTGAARDRPRRRVLADPDQGESTFLGNLLRSESVGGSIALVAAVIALVWANLGFNSYEQFRAWQVGPLDVEHWASEGGVVIAVF